MIKLYANSIILDLHTAIISTVTDEKIFRDNLGKILPKNDLYAIVKQMENPPYSVNLIYPFKQLIVRIQISKVPGSQNVMIFYNCKNELSIAENICKGFKEWDEDMKKTFMTTFYTVLANYNEKDIAELHLAT